MSLGIQPIFEDAVDMITGASDYVIAKQVSMSNDQVLPSSVSMARIPHDSSLIAKKIGVSHAEYMQSIH
jgi:hypothetical protein